MFTHLHVHSNFSFYDGAAPIADLVEATARLGMTALALTDHNTLSGAVRFYRAARQAGIKPIIGVEFDVEPVGEQLLTSSGAPAERRQNDGGTRAEAAFSPVPRLVSRTLPEARLLLLALDNTGYSHLCRLVTCAQLGEARSAGPFSPQYEEIDRKHPRLLQEHLREHASHLLAISPGSCGEISILLQAGDYRAAAGVARYYADLFGSDNFYLELQHHLHPPEGLRRPTYLSPPRESGSGPEVSPPSPARGGGQGGGAIRHRLARLAAQLSLPTVAGNDVHYVTPDHAPLQEALFCLGQGISVRDGHSGRKTNSEYYLKSPAQMARLFADYPEALAATEEIAARCNWELDLETIHLPRFDAASIPEFPGDPDSAADRAAFLEQLCRQALPSKYGMQVASGRWPVASSESPPASHVSRLVTTREESSSPPSPARRGGQGGETSLRAAAERQLEHELAVINQRGLADYFLIVWDLVRFAESRGIRHSGRGSAADSIVCYLLDITQPEPLSNDLLFERFLNPERRDLPDIDLDFDTRRRDEVTAYIYRKYGPEHVAAVGTVNTFRARAAIRELGKVLGLSERQINRVAQNFAYVDLHRLPEMMQALPEARGVADELAEEQTLLLLCEQVGGYPRHIAVHVGGLIISEQPLTDLVPLQLANKGIVVAQYDKDDVAALGLLKMDILGLRIHTAIEHCLGLINRPGGTGVSPVRRFVGRELVPRPSRYNGRLTRRNQRTTRGRRRCVRVGRASSPSRLPHTPRRAGWKPAPRGREVSLSRLPLDDPAAYELIRSTQTIGLFQLESPGQRNLQGRLLADKFEDLVAGISLFRPGPVQADMITPFIARRRGQEPVTYLHPALEPILARTYGVMIYQEQVMRVAAAIGGFSLGEADRLRKAMNWDSSTGAMQRLHETFVQGARRQGITEAIAEQIFSQVAAFAAFGFNKAHAASFARISYETAYLKAHYPAEYFAGLLTAQPMGFYPPRTLAEEAKRMGIAILPPCVNRSEADYTVERTLSGTTGVSPFACRESDGRDARRTALRCGLRFVRDMSSVALEQILAARAAGGPFLSLRDFLTRAHPPYPVVENLILARAFDWTGQSLPQLLGLLAALHLTTSPPSPSRQRGGQNLTPLPSSPCGRGGRGGSLTLDLDEPHLELSSRVSLGEEITPYQRLQLDLHLLGLSTELHPFAPWVEMTAREGVIPCARLLEYPDKAKVKVAGIVVARARPPVRSGRTTLFICLEDHTGLVDITIFSEAYQKYGEFLYTAPVLLAEGELTRRGARDVAVTVKRVYPLPIPKQEGTPVAEEELAEVYRQTGPGSYGG